MKKILLALLVICTTIAVRAQDKKPPTKMDFSTRSGDHLIVQLSSDHWLNVPDSIGGRIKGFSRGLNVHFMLDKPFKSNPKISVAFGLGVSTSNMFFDKTNVDIKSTRARLPFTQLDTLNHFKKFKLTTTFLEIPIELRFSSKPQENGKSIKFAVGAKVGTLLKAQTKGKTLRDRNENAINAYTEKTSNKRFFNGTRIAATARVGIGMYTLFAAYQVNNLLKDGAGPEIRPLQVGLSISGL